MDLNVRVVIIIIIIIIIIINYYVSHIEMIVGDNDKLFTMKCRTVIS